MIVCCEGAEPPRRTAEEAAGLAVYYSQARQAGRASVDYTMVLYYLDAGNEEAIRQMMTEAGSRLDETVEKEYCRNQVLNMILSSAAQKAEEKGIDFRCAAADCELPLSVRTDFATIILNLLENAQNAASKVPEAGKPFIKVDIFYESAQLIVRIANSYTGELHFSDDS